MLDVNGHRSFDYYKLCYSCHAAPSGMANSFWDKVLKKLSIKYDIIDEKIRKNYHYTILRECIFR